MRSWKNPSKNLMIPILLLPWDKRLSPAQAACGSRHLTMRQWSRVA